MKAILRCGLSISLAAVLIAPRATALDYPLSSEAIREAYFLGSGDPDKFALFLDKYTRHYTPPKSGVYIGVIEFETPYVLVAESVSQHANYHAPDAVQEFLGKPAVCRVRVEVYWGLNGVPSATGRNTHYPTNYTVHVTQGDKELRAKASWTESLLSPSSSPVEIGIAFNSEYDAGKVAADSAATIEVDAPDGSSFSETFDLPSLR